MSRGEFHQHPLWTSSLPLGRDLHRRARKYPTVNAADMVPLIGTKCGSPTGVPFAFADPGRTVELMNPYDEEHANHTLVISGRSGSGKTMTACVLLSRCLAAGARGFVIDRAGHYETLTRLLDGAQQVEIGADDSPYALNPWDVPDPAKVSREKIAFLLALHQVMMGGLDARQIGMIGAAIRAVYAKAAALPGSQPRESMLQDELRAQAREAQDPTRSTSPRRCGTSPTACRSTAGRAPTRTCSTAPPPSPPTRRWLSSTPAAARNQSCGS